MEALNNVPPHVNYLRVRGEYTQNLDIMLATRELPPRARRIRTGLNTLPNMRGTTSACAENTPEKCGVQPCARNYLRVRGEYLSLDPEIAFLTELPPRARRIRYFWKGRIVTIGTTSACAENTQQLR